MSTDNSPKPPKMSDNSGGSSKEPKRGVNFMFIAFIAIFIYFIIATFVDNKAIKDAHPLTTQELIKALENNQISDAVLSGSTVTGKITMGDEKLRDFKATITPYDEKTLKLLRDKSSGFDVDAETSAWENMLMSLIPWLLIFGFFYFFLFRQMRQGGPGGIMSIGRSKARMIDKDKLTKTFDDVAGIEEAREEVQELVEFLKVPEKFSEIGGRLPKGVLLVGPPGTGKTLLAKAIAGEAGRPFFSISGSDFVEMFVGVGASRVRDLFNQAKANSPCIIFLDEIDAIGRKRGNGLGGGNDEREQTLNAILVEMDGFEDNSGIIIIAATNRPDVLDSALLRPGRFDRQVYVDLPDIKGREQILKVHAKKIKLEANVDLMVIARGTPGFSGAELENLLNEAAVIAAFADCTHVHMKHLEEARDKVCWGKQKRSKVMNDKDKSMTAYHEAGHAILAFFLPEVDPLHKVTIMPRGRALGMAMYLPQHDRYDRSKSRCMGDISVAFGGRVAEETFCDDIGAGAVNDIQQATTIARKMVTAWGMSDMGPVAYEDPNQQDAFGNSGPKQSFSEQTLKHIDDEIRNIIHAGLDKAREIINSHQDEMHRIAQALLKYETLEAIDVEALINNEDITERLEAKLAAAKKEEIAKKESAKRSKDLLSKEKEGKKDGTKS